MDDAIIVLDSDVEELDNDFDSSNNKPNNHKNTNTQVDESGKSKNKKRKYFYEAVDEDLKLEAEIDKARILSELTPSQIEYMVLRDINYYIDIFSGCCEHSWRHSEFKKFSKKSGNLLYANSAMTSYTYDQYMGAVKALQSVFCKKDHKYDEYIVKVLLPEALIKICMRVYQCSKDSAEEYLKKNNIKTCFVDYPKGSVIYSPSNATKLNNNKSY